MVTEVSQSIAEMTKGGILVYLAMRFAEYCGDDTLHCSAPLFGGVGTGGKATGKIVKEDARTAILSILIHVTK